MQTSPTPLFMASLATATLLATGCSSLPRLPDADFAGITIRTVQDQQNREKVRLALGLDFKVKNPMDVVLNVPQHSFDLLIDGAPATKTGVHQPLSVPANGEAMARYEFQLDLSDEGLGGAFGRNAGYTFAASADVDVPGELIKVLGGQLASNTRSKGVDASGNPLGKTTLNFSHDGNIKLPKFPRIASLGKDSASVEMIGETKIEAIDNVLGDLNKVVKPLADFLTKYKNARAAHSISVPVKDVLGWLGVPSNITGTVVSAMNTAMTLQGTRNRIPSVNQAITVPVQLPALDQLVSKLDPNAGNMVRTFSTDWNQASAAKAAQLAGVQIPTSLPGGIKIAMPFAINNPNQFPIHTPAFKLALVNASGAPVAKIDVAPQGAAQAVANAPGLETIEIAGQQNAPVNLTSELHWDKLGTDLLSMAGGNKGPDFSALTMVGEVSIDLGYGPITVPIKVPLAGGAATSGATNPSPAAPAAPAKKAPTLRGGF